MTWKKNTKVPEIWTWADHFAALNAFIERSTRLWAIADWTNHTIIDEENCDMGLFENRGCPQIANVIGTMMIMIIHWNCGYPIFRQTHSPYWMIHQISCRKDLTTSNVPLNLVRPLGLTNGNCPSMNYLDETIFSIFGSCCSSVIRWQGPCMWSASQDKLYLSKEVRIEA
jgi:hypothetical protein